MEKDLQKSIDDAATYNIKGVLRGHVAVGPMGQLVLIPPGKIRLTASPERGVYVAGLKDGWRLATKDDVRRKEAEETVRQRQEAETDDAARDAEFRSRVAAELAAKTGAKTGSPPQTEKK